MTLRLRKWWHAGAEVTIRLTEIIGDDDGKRLHAAVLAFSRALNASPASPADTSLKATDEAMEDGNSSSVADSALAVRAASTETEGH